MFSSLKYLIIGLISTIGLLFLIWFAILVQQHPNDWRNYHLDLESTFKDFIHYFDNVRFSSLGGFDVGDGDSILSKVSSWFSNTMSQGFSYINVAQDKMSDILNKNTWLSFTLALSGITQLYYAVMLIAKTILVGGFLITFLINIIDLLVSFLVAFLSAISHPYFIYFDTSYSLTSLACII